MKSSKPVPRYVRRSWTRADAEVATSLSGSSPACRRRGRQVSSPSISAIMMSPKTTSKGSAAHQLDLLRGDGKAQPGPPAVAHAGAALLEGLEDFPARLGRDARAGVGDFKPVRAARRLPRAALARQPQRDRAFFGELYGV